MVLEKLIDSLMRTAIEHAGAERGLLILPRGDQFLIAAEATTGGNDVTVHQGEGADSGAAMPESLVRYVMRTQENVILEDASSQNPFSADPYIVQRHPRSVLTLPLINQGKLISILHLENNLTSRVFTPDRIAVLKVLASQAAIALENARLYRDLEQREAEIRALKAVLSRVAKVAPTDSTVFITGETGTGKELIARAVHKRSDRSGRAFVS